MFLSLAILFLLGGTIAILFPKIRVPSLIGYLLLGMGMSALGLFDESLSAISSQVRKIALMIILLKAGLSLDFQILKKVGRPAILMCFVPATFEILSFLLFGTLLLGLSPLESLLIGTVLGAVSPAVVVPRMSKLIDEGIGTRDGIPEMILAGSSADDVYCIVLFTAFAGMLSSGSTFNGLALLKIPTSLGFGILTGLGLGLGFSFLFKKLHIRDTLKLAILLGTSFLLIWIESLLDKTPVSLSSYLAVIAMGIVLFARNKEQAKRLTVKANKIWVVAEIFLFSFVGASVQWSSLASVGWMIALVFFLGLLFRMAGTYCCLIGTKLSMRQRLYVMFAETPKATVQAAIGGALIGVVGIDQSYANLVLAISVLSILICAPLGAILMDTSYKKLLN